MDLLAALLDGPRARDAFVLRLTMMAPWSIRLEDRSPLTLIAVVKGGAWLKVDDDAAPVELGPGDVAIDRGLEPYTLANPPERRPDVIVHPGQRCTTPDGVDLHEALMHGVRSWGNDPQGDTLLLVGAYPVEGEIGQRLLDALPARCTVRASEPQRRLIDLMTEEVTNDRFGQQAVLDRLLDVLLIGSLRGWFDHQAQPPAWYRAQVDPVIGPALRLLHERPAHTWTVALLAREVGVARPTLARRFTDVLGEGPISYLTSWRMALAADLLRGPEATVTAVAPQVGYSTPFAFSAAFKRTFGISPSTHMAQVRHQPPMT